MLTADEACEFAGEILGCIYEILSRANAAHRHEALDELSKSGCGSACRPAPCVAVGKNGVDRYATMSDLLGQDFY